jgi:signal transduction histidine kinase
VALENAQLYEQQEERVRQLATLNEILTRLTGTLSLESVLNTVMESAGKLSPGVTGTALYLFWDEHKSTLALLRSAGLSDRFLVDPPDPLIMGRAHRHELAQQPVVIENVTALGTSLGGTFDGENSSHNLDPDVSHLRALMMRENKAAWIELPLSVGGVGLGALVLYYDVPQSFLPEHIEMLRTFATQVAQAISNARLYSITDEALERRVGQLLALAAIGHELTATKDIESICTLVVNHALDSSNTKIGGLILLDIHGQVELLKSRGYASTTFVNAVRASQGITGQVLATGKAIIAHNVLEHPNYYPLNTSTRSQLSVPMLSGTRVMGVITLESDKEHAFSEEDIDFIGQLANQAVIAIASARLFRDIEEARDRLQVILNAMREALVLIDGQGVVGLVNPGVEMLGLSPDALIGQRIEDLLERNDMDLATRFGFASESDLRRIVKTLRSSMTWTEREPVKYMVERDGSSLRIQRQIIALRAADLVPLMAHSDGFETSHSGSGLVGVLMVFYDETEEYKLTQTREDLSRMLVHDLRSPLTAVTTSLKLLTEIVPKDSSFRPMVENTTDAARRAIRKLLSRVDSLLDVARMENGYLSLETKPTELAMLVNNVQTELDPLAQELNINIECDGVESLPPLLIDADKVERVLLNLLDNALKFSPLDSRVGIRAAAPSKGSVTIEVIDSGPGVSDEYKTKLFDRYVQVEGRSGARRGSGLGLTFCRFVVEAHGGRIWIEDNPGGGSKFIFTLPTT